LRIDAELSPDDLRLLDLIVEWEESLQSGRPRSPEQLCANDPHLLAALQTAIGQLATVDRLLRIAPRSDEPFQENRPGRDRASFPAILPQLPGYEILVEIARGGMGIVFQARQVTANRIVAVKMIRAGSFARPEDVQRFHTEAEAAARLDHPAIVPIHEVNEHQGQPYFSMGFVDGQSLSKKLAEGPLPARQAAEIIRAVADAVQYAHDQGVIHRDLKPGNILLDRTGKPKVSDFGLAKLTEGNSDLTGTGQIMGTASYMPPEQAAGQVTAVGRLADVYSLGAVLYCLLIGRPPFQAATPLETLVLVRTLEPVAPTQLNPAIPLDLNTIVLKCLEKDPARRYQSAQEVALELQRYLTGEPIVARPISVVERSWRWCRRRPLIPSVVAAVLAVSIVAGLLYRQAAQQSLRREVAMTVDAAQKSRGAAVPYAIRELKRLPAVMVLDEIHRRYSDAAVLGKLALAYVLVEYGQTDIDFLLSQIKESGPDEVDNFVTAFGRERNRTLTAIQTLAKRSQSDEPDWSLKARLAIVALHLDDQTMAADMCRIDDRPDPVERTVFIDELSGWHGALANLRPSSRTIDDHSFRSALCLGLAGVDFDRLNPEEKSAWQPVFAAWYSTAPDAVTHSAAGLALRKWGVKLPDIAASSAAPENRDWFVNGEGMTMMKVPPGTFEMGDVSGQVGSRRHQVELTKAYFLCDREVSVEHFDKFLDDDAWQTENEPKVRPEVRRLFDHCEDCPVGSVTWFEALAFCNWLSDQEQRPRCYRLSDGDAWSCDRTLNGYRLPTEAEWEFACRAGTATRFSFGDDASRFPQYGTIRRSYFSTGWGRGQKLANGWGFFDMYGNVSEWCGDWFLAFDGKKMTDPEGAAAGDRRVERGGGYSAQGADECGSGVRSAEAPGQFFPTRGFRVAFSHKP
jgi:formylglycine-generating enzyme required for sulfatase activity